MCPFICEMCPFICEICAFFREIPCRMIKSSYTCDIDQIPCRMMKSRMIASLKKH